MGRLYNSVGDIDSASSSPSSSSSSSSCSPLAWPSFHRFDVVVVDARGALGGRAVVVKGKGVRGVQSFVCGESPVGMDQFGLPMTSTVLDQEW